MVKEAKGLLVALALAFVAAGASALSTRLCWLPYVSFGLAVTVGIISIWWWRRSIRIRRQLDQFELDYEAIFRACMKSLSLVDGDYDHGQTKKYNEVVKFLQREKILEVGSFKSARESVDGIALLQDRGFIEQVRGRQKFLKELKSRY